MAAPALKALSGLPAGAWQANPAGGSVCTRNPEMLLTGGRPAQGCQFNVIRDEQTHAAVTYQCSGGRQGRTELRRDTNNLLSMDAQGLERGLPFAERSEWRRQSSCGAGHNGTAGNSGPGRSAPGAMRGMALRGAN